MPEKTSQPPKRSGIFSAVWRGFVVFIVLLIGLEGFARLPVVQNKVPIQSFGFSNSLFELKWAKLKLYIRENGVPDVIIIGNSMVNTGIDTEVITKRIEDESHKSIRIFNFGVEGLNISAMPDLAQVILETYHPKILIVGTEIRDYSLRLDQAPSDEFMSTPWLQYRLGKQNFIGALIDHSELLKFGLVFRNWFLPGFAQSFMTMIHDFKMVINSTGYDPDQRVPVRRYNFPNPFNPVDQPLFKIFHNYSYDPGRLVKITELTELGRKYGTDVIFLEMPVQKTLYWCFDQPKLAREDFLDHIRAVIQAAGTKLIESPIFVDIPDNGWSSRTHLNKVGAPIFSSNLADQLIALPEIQGLLK